MCGEVENQPYMAAVNLTTGIPVWERSVQGSGRLTRLTRNHLGQFIAMGDFAQSPYYDVLVMAVGSTGTLHWFRDYGVGAGNCFQGDVTTASNGDLFLTYNSEGDIVVVRTTEWGHTIWSARYSSASGNGSSIRAEATPDGGLLLAGNWYGGLAYQVFTLRIDGDGDVEWARRYDIANPTDEPTLLSSLALRANGSALIGVQLYDGNRRRCPPPGDPVSMGLQRAQEDRRSRLPCSHQRQGTGRRGQALRPGLSQRQMEHVSQRLPVPVCGQRDKLQVGACPRFSASPGCDQPLANRIQRLLCHSGGAVVAV